MLIARTNQRGFSLIELIIGVVIIGILTSMAIPAFGTWSQNTQIRNAADSIQNGLQQARVEAIRRNTPVRFQLTTTVDNSCAISTGQANWVINLGDGTTNDPTSKCGMAIAPAVTQWGASATPAPYVIQRSSANASPNVTVTSNGAAANWVVAFGALGQVISTTSETQWDLKNAKGGACAASGPMTCMRILVSPNGRIRMCNPLPSLAGTPQGC
jgi:type IV fimbrial biogenesis protein FimT